MRKGEILFSTSTKLIVYYQLVISTQEIHQTSGPDFKNTAERPSKSLVKSWRAELPLERSTHTHADVRRANQRGTGTSSSREQQTLKYSRTARKQSVAEFWTQRPNPAALSRLLSLAKDSNRRGKIGTTSSSITGKQNPLIYFSTSNFLSFHLKTL